MTATLYDAVVIGGGFFGCELAAYLKRERGFGRVLIVEQEAQLMNRASRWNQARIHGGYHYPRDFVTAHRSRVSQPLFVKNYRQAIYQNVTSLYAIARRGSHVSAETFLRRMKQAGAAIEPASSENLGLFSPAFVEDVFQVEEAVFDADALRALVENQLADFSIELSLDTSIYGVEGDPNQIRIIGSRAGASELTFTARYAFNCTYSGLNTISQEGRVVSSKLKYEAAELTLIEVPDELKSIAITVMDGPFFSAMPYPPERVHSLSHVRYTPAFSWNDDGTRKSPYQVLADEPKDRRSNRMIRDASRFVPKLGDAKVVGAFREVKTVMADRENNDGRPILIEQSERCRRLFSILGGKIDNVFDMFQFFDSVAFDRATS